MSKPKNLNAFVIRAKFVETDKDEIHIELGCRRKAPKGKRDRYGAEFTLRLILDPFDVTSIAEAGSQGLRKLVENAQATVAHRLGYIERMKRIAGAA